MNSYQQEFRSQTFNSIFSSTGKIFKELMVGGGLYTLMSLLSLLPLLGLLTNLDLGALASMQNSTDPEEVMGIMQEVMGSFLASFGVKEFVLFSLVVLLSMAILAWFTVFVMLALEARIKGNRWSISQVLQTSFSPSVLWVFLYQIVMMVIYLVMMGAVAFSAMASGFASFLILILAAVLMMRLILSQAAIVHGRMSVAEAMYYSFSKVGFAKAFKYLGLGILAAIGLSIAFMVVYMIAALFVLIPVVGILINLAVNFIAQYMMLGLFIVLQSVLYFKSDEDLEGSKGMDLEEHLIV